MTKITHDELLTALPRLQRIAGKLACQDDRVAADDLLQQMCLVALERRTWPARRTASFIGQSGLWVGLQYRRRSLQSGGYEIVKIEDIDDDCIQPTGDGADQEEPFADAVADEYANPEVIVEEHELQAERQTAVRSWFEQVLAGEALTPAERRTLGDIRASIDVRKGHRPLSGAARTNRCYHLRQIRAKYPNPLAANA